MPRLPVLLLALLALSACGDDPAADPDLGADAPGTDGVEEGVPPVPDAPALTGAACLLGTWAVDAERSFRPEVWESLAPGGEVRFEYGGTSGRALLTFEPGGATRQAFEDFALTLNGDTPAGEMSTTVSMSGTAEGRYTVEGDRLLFEPGEADLTTQARVHLGGNVVSNAAMDLESLFEGGERGRTTFICRGDELLLDIHEDAEGGRVLFDDARYTRVSGP